MSKLIMRLLQALKSRHDTAHAEKAVPILKTVAISMVRNEQDIIEPFVRHASKLVDLLVVLDNLSADNTRLVLSELSRELGNVVVTDWSDEAHNQSETMSAALQHIQAACFAEYVLFLDADEFLSVEDAPTLYRHLQAIPQGGIGLMPWRTYIPSPHTDEQTGSDPLNNLVGYRREEEPQYYKAVLRLDGAVIPDLVVEQGNHGVHAANGDILPSIVLDSLPLLHVPIRSDKQLRAKGLVSWMANSKRENAASGEAYQWKHLNMLAEKSSNLSDQDVALEALSYAQSERDGNVMDHVVPSRFPFVDRRLTDGASKDPQVLLQLAQKAPDADFQVPAVPGRSSREPQIKNAFDANLHSEHMFLDIPPIKFAIELLQPRSILDVGCGNGVYPLLYKHLGVDDVLAVDGLDADATLLDSSVYRQMDLQVPNDFERVFDTVVCLQVLEHLEPGSTEVALDTIARHAEKSIVFSVAEPGQPGNGHINCKTQVEVLEMFERRGWFPNMTATLGFRLLASMSWFRRNTIVFHRDPSSADVTADILTKIGSFRHEWWGQASGVRQRPFSEPVPAPPAGYGQRLN